MEDQRESPETVAAEFGAQGVEALPRRLDRYGKAKKRALDVAEYMAEGDRLQRRIGARVASCGEWLAFRHYYTIDEVRLHAASLCMKHLLCPLCAIRRGAKALKAYLDRWEVIRAARSDLRPFLVTLTVKDGDDLSERFRHLYSSQRALWMQKHRGRGSVLDLVAGAVWSYEVKRGKGSGQWHPHLHMIALAPVAPLDYQLRDEWHGITGDSHIVDVRQISQADEASGFLEVFKYALKFSDMEPSDTVEAFTVLRGKRLIGSAGAFRGVDIPENLTDAALDDLPFTALFYRYLGGAYALA